MADVCMSVRVDLRFCYQQGWCVKLRDKDFLAEGKHAWFEKYACPHCFAKGERSTRSEQSIRLTSSKQSSECSDLHESAKILWEKVMETSSTTSNVSWICKMATMSVEGLEDDKLGSKSTDLEVRRWPRDARLARARCELRPTILASRFIWQKPHGFSESTCSTCFTGQLESSLVVVSAPVSIC